MYKNGFSLAECLTTLSLIGILAVTMLTINNFNEDKAAQVVMAEIESELENWGKKLISSNETGLGATDLITNQNTLVSSLVNYFNTTGKIINNVNFKGDDGENYRNCSMITLSNGATLTVKFVATGPAEIQIGNKIYKKNLYDSNLVVIKIDVPKKHNRVLSEQYGFKQNKVMMLSNIWQ